MCIRDRSKFSDIKYARPTFTIGKGTFKKTSPKLDLILAAPDIHKLTTVLFNLRAFIMNKKEEKSTITMSHHGPGAVSYTHLTNTKTLHHADSIYGFFHLAVHFWPYL